MEPDLKFEGLIEQILEKSYGILDDFLDSSEVDDLNKSFNIRTETNAFKKAGISKNNEIAAEIRGDEIFWLDNTEAFPAEMKYLEKIEYLIRYLNFTCYLGLSSYEFHFAKYPVGTFYKRHLDRFSNDSRRKLSVVFYLNENWTDDLGGQLRIYTPEGQTDITPAGGRIVVFESDKLEHEVLPASRERKSVTGWLKTS